MLCRVLAYVSELYSVAWNEALTKKLQDIDILVVSEALKVNNDGLCDVQQVLNDLQLLPSSPQDLSIPFTPVEVFTDDASRWEGCGAHVSVQDYNSSDLIIELERGFMEHNTIFVAPETSLSRSTYDFVALGGTFDHLHAGHKVSVLDVATLIVPHIITFIRFCWLLRQLFVPRSWQSE